MVQKRLNLPGISLADKVKLSLDTIKKYAPDDDVPYYGCFSGGKDSIVIKRLAEIAGVPVTWTYNVTTIDPPELLKFMRKHHGDVVWDKPEKPFFYMAAEVRGFPTRLARWCCEVYKESRSPKDARLLMGVRAAESPRRAKTWGLATLHRRTLEYVINPIFYWSGADVWEYIRSEGMPYCSLYDEGFKRLGCIGCPMAGERGRKAEFVRWPRYEYLWKRMFRRVWDRRTGSLQRDGRAWFGDKYFKNWEEMWHWWLNDVPLPTDKCEGVLDMFS